jgi:DNA repair photolyase
MRWDSLLTGEEAETTTLPLFSGEAVVRRFKTPQFRGMTFYEVAAKSIINHVPGDRYGFNWTINPYRGCSHACSYCFARPTHSYLDFDTGRDFETKIVVKVNAAQLLRRELRRPSWSGELIAMGTNTDPYQRAEGHYKLMRAILTELNAARNPYSILTKGTLIQRDLDLLREGAAVTEVNANFSVGTVDEKVWEATEPGTPHPRKRLEVVRMLNEAGIPCGVLRAPILPGISDSPEQLEATVKAAAAAGATHITPITLHLRPGVKEEFLPWLADHHPELVKPYAAIYRGSYAPKDVTEPIGRAVGELRRRYGANRNRPTGGRGGPQPAESEPGPDEKSVPSSGEATEQLSLDVGGEGPRRAPARQALVRRSGRSPATKGSP